MTPRVTGETFSTVHLCHVSCVSVSLLHLRTLPKGSLSLVITSCCTDYTLRTFTTHPSIGRMKRGHRTDVHIFSGSFFGCGKRKSPSVVEAIKSRCKDKRARANNSRMDSRQKKGGMMDKRIRQYITLTVSF